jgi:hypothetical protein
LEVFAQQNKQLLEELTSLSIHLQSSEALVERLESDLNRSKAEDRIIEQYSIKECEELEQELRAALTKVEKRKVQYITISLPCTLYLCSLFF